MLYMFIQHCGHVSMPSKAKPVKLAFTFFFFLLLVLFFNVWNFLRRDRVSHVAQAIQGLTM